jgi:hypothetical protein
MLTTFDLDEYVFDALSAGAYRVPADARSPGGTAVRDQGRVPTVTR